MAEDVSCVLGADPVNGPSQPARREYVALLRTRHRKPPQDDESFSLWVMLPVAFARGRYG